MAIHPNCKVQIKALIFIKVFIIFLAKYSNYNNVFSIKNITDFSKYIKINNHIIKLKIYKQPIFKLIYSLDPVKLETLKIYIKINLAYGFI